MITTTNALTTLVFVFLTTVAATPPTPLECSALRSLKSWIYQQVCMGRSVEIANGNVDPLEYYDWKDTLFVNWRVVPEKVHDLEEVLFLPENIHIANISLVEGESPGPFVSLVAKLVDVIQLDATSPSTTAQFDWIVYVVKDDVDREEPNLMIIDSIYDFDVVTPLGQVFAPNDIDYFVNDANVAAAFIDKDDSMRLDLMLELGVSANKTVSESFHGAFDRLYWPNGIYTVLASDSSLRSAQVQIMERSLRQQWDAQDVLHPWSDYTELVPRHSFFFPESIRLAAEIWVNIDDRSSHTLADDEYEYLLQLKKDFYSRRAAIEASRVAELSSETLVRFVLTQQEFPAYFLNFRLRSDKLDALATEIGLPDGFSLAPIRMRENGPEEYILTLNVYSVQGIVSGLRAEWSVFVKEDGSSDQPLFMIVEALSSGMSLDPVNLLQMTGVDQFESYVDDGIVKTVIVESSDDPDGTTFTAVFPLPDICTGMDMNASSLCDIPDPALIAANDRMYWGNGVYDKGYWDGNAWRIDQLAVVNASDVNVVDGTKWSVYVEDIQEIIVFFEQQTFFIGPWYNLNKVCPPP